MATKPLDQLSPDYRRRIERGLASGKTRQQARGHKPQEHITRAEHVTARGGVTQSEKALIRRWVDATADRADLGRVDFDADEAYEDFLLDAEEGPRGKARILGAARAAQDLRAAWRRRHGSGYAGVGAAGMAILAQRFMLAEHHFWYH